MTLSVVTDYVDAVAEQPMLPMFEGEPVEGLRAKLVSGASLELHDGHHRLDQTARLLVTGRVTRVDHVVDERTGRLVRIETFKVVDAVEVPWDIDGEADR